MPLMTRAAARKAMLRPKPTHKPFIPALPFGDLSPFVGLLAPAERKLLDWIANNADLIIGGDPLLGGIPFLLVELRPEHLDTLAAFGAAAEDLELDLEDEAGFDDEGAIETDGCPTEDMVPGGYRHGPADEAIIAAATARLAKKRARPRRRRSSEYGKRSADEAPIVRVDATGLATMADGSRWQGHLLTPVRP